MKADLSRNTFDPARHFSAVRLQQGRIVTDADWNEQADLTRDRAERLALDAIGGCGGPLDGAGYALVAETRAFAVAAVDASQAWVACEDGALLHSSDGGASWTLVDAGSAAHLRAIAAAGSALWVAGDDGTVRRSADGGATWDAAESGTARPLYGVSAAGADAAWVVGEGGILLAFSDGGHTVGLTQTDAARLYAIDVDAATGRGVAVGHGGAIVFRADGLASWSSVGSGSEAHLRAVARTPGGRLVAAGDGGTILTSDDGDSWLAADTPTEATLRAVAFRDDSTGWAAGDDGTLLATSDGGAHWSALDAGTIAALRGLAAAGAGAAWVVGDASTLRRVDDGSPTVVPGALPAVNLRIEPGRYWVHGTLCELEAACSYAHQADGGAGERLAPGTHLLYLDAWQRHVSALQDPRIREVALGGPDTASRSHTLAQVRALPLPATSPDTWSCASAVDAWDELLAPPRPRLAARAEPQLAASSLCEIAATAGYRRLENQLYRVEVHEGGATPTFKWSRENGSVEYAVVALSVDETASETTVRVAARGRDTNLDLAADDRVELVDDDSEATARAGAMLRYTADGNDELELVLAGVPPGTLGRDPARHPLLRRWDQHPASGDVLPIVEDEWIELEEGVQVRFEPGGVYRPGDHWQIPARTITGDVEWPRSDDGDPLALEPAGIADAYCRIGLVEVAADGTVTVTGDCRNLFPPLTEMVNLLAGGGDGQDGPPNAVLPQPLEVRVHRGGLPLAGAPVRFEVQTGGGAVGPDGGPTAATLKLTTDSSGRASCRWTLGPGLTAPARHQRVVARLLDAGGTPIDGQALVFDATASLTLQTIGGDGQQAPSGATLPVPIRARVVHGGDGVGGFTLTTAVTGGGAVTPASVTTTGSGDASFNWRLGNSGTQTLTVTLVDANGNTVQRLVYGATVVNPAQGGGCAITIGKDGAFEQLDQKLLEQLLDEHKGALCLCFLPGEHRLDGLDIGAGNNARLSLHGCGPTAIVRVGKPITLAGFDALELRDLTIRTAGSAGLALVKNRDVRLAGLTIGPDGDAVGDILLEVGDAERLQMSGCAIGPAKAASAVIASIAVVCHVTGNRFDGTVSFYGPPGPDRSQDLIKLYANHPTARLSGSQGRLCFVDNELPLLSIGAPVVERLLKRDATGLFQSALLQGNSFGLPGNVFASVLANFGDNTLLAQKLEAGTVYGVVFASRAAAAGNVAALNNETAVLHFLFPRNGGFSGAANQVFTQPPSLN